MDILLKIMVNGTAYCKVCLGEIHYTTSHFGPHRYPLSKEGTDFSGSWFCNDCWDKIIDYAKEKGIIK